MQGGSRVRIDFHSTTSRRREKNNNSFEDDMSKGSMSTRSDDPGETALGWATGQCDFPRRRQRIVVFDILLSCFRKISQGAARAVRNLVTCSIPQLNGFERNVTTASQESSEELRDIQDETSSTTSNLQILPEKPMHDGWSTIDETSSSHQWKISHDQDADNGEHNLWTQDEKVTSNPNYGPKLPSNFFELPTKQRLRAVKQLLAGYVHKPNSETSLQANKYRPLCRLMATARMIVYKPGPIKAVEAVFVALYLTAGLLSVERVPVGFKTKFADEITQHTVLLVRCHGKYGAFGINSNPDLMTKNLQFDSMSNIIESYLKAYEASAHNVLKVQIGLPVEHDVLSSHFICWHHLSLSPSVESWQECVEEIENHVLRMRRLWDLWVLTRKGDDSRKAGMAKRKLSRSNLLKKARGKGIEKQHGVAASEMKMPGKSPRKSHGPFMTTERTQDWDAESTGSNSNECEHCEECEQLKRAVPPSDTKCVSLTSTVKEMKTSGHQYFPRNLKFHGDQSHTSEQQGETESFESNTGDSSMRNLSVDFKPQGLNQRSLATTQQMLKNLMSKRVTTSDLPSSPVSRGRTRNPTEKSAHIKLQSKSMRKKNSGPLYNLSVGQSRKSMTSKLI